MTKYLCDIVPLTHLPLSRGATLWYESDRQLEAGTLVRVPLFRRTVNGVVLACKDDFARAGSVKLKQVAQIIAPAHFTMHQIALATHISQTTFTPLGVVLESFLIARVAERSAPQFAQISSDASAAKLTPITQKIYTDIADSLNSDKYQLLRDTSATARDELIVALIAHLLETSPNAQILILLPEVLVSVQTSARLSKRFDPSIIATVHHKTAAGTLSRIRDEVRTGKLRIIIGTRKSLILPFANLSLIVIDEEQDMSFKQWDRAPRFDARTVARFLGRISQCPTIAFSTSPRISHTVPLPIATEPSTNPITLVDMRAEQNATAKGSTPPIISEILRNSIEKALKNKEQVLLFVNKKGTSNFSICIKCRTLLACPDCDRALIGVTDNHDCAGYECVHCSYSITHATCADCSSVAFANIGFGTQKIASMMTRLFPTAQIARIDGHSLRLTHAAADITEQMQTGKIDILIGTQMALKDWRLRNLSVVGIIDADSLRAIPDIYADEHLYSHIANAAACVTHLYDAHNANQTGVAIVQTFHPDYPTLTDARARDYDNFRIRTLATRAMLKYPPNWRIVKLIFQHRDDKRVARIAQKFHETIIELSPSNDNEDTVIISPVHEPMLPKLRTFWRTQIIIKLRNPDAAQLIADTTDNAPIPDWLANTLISTPPRTIIDIDPVSLV